MSNMKQPVELQYAIDDGALHLKCTMVWQVKQQVQDFKARESRVADAEQLASSYSLREAALTTRQQSVAALEDRAQQADAAAEYARKEADAIWDKQKVSILALAKFCQ